MADNLNVSSEGAENQKINPNDFSYLKEQSKKFARKKLTGNSDGKNITDTSFYNNFSQNKYTKEKFVEDFKSTLNEKDLKEFLKMTDDEKDKLFNSFKDEISRLGFSFEQKKQELNDTIKEDYELSTTNRRKLQDILDGLKQEEIEEFIISQTKTAKFIKSKFGDTLKKKDNKIRTEINSILSKFTYNSSDEFLEQIKKTLEETKSEETLEDVLQTLSHIKIQIQSGQPIEIYDIKDLFSYGIFSDEQKKLFVETFLKTISLQELVDLGIIDLSSAQRKKEELLMKFLLDKGWKTTSVIDSNDIELIELINSTSLSDIEVKTSEYFKDNLEKLSNSQTLNERLTKITNETIEEVKDEYISQILNADVLKTKLGESDVVRKKIVGRKQSLDKFQKGTTIKITSRVSKDSKETIEGFMEIDSLGNDGNFKIIDRSGNNKINISEDIKPSTMTYIELFESLESNNLITGVEFIDQQELKEQKNSGKIKETTNELGEATIEDKENFKSYIDEELAELRKGKLEDGTLNQARIDELEVISKNVLSGNYNLDEVKEELSFFVLKSRIKELDEDGEKYGFAKGVTFSLKKGTDDTDKEEEEKRTFTITDIDPNATAPDGNKGMITIVSHRFGGLKQHGSFKQFFELFKEKGIKRISNTTELPKMIENLSLDDKVGELWKDFEFKDGQIQKKSTEHDIAYTYLAETKKSGGKEVLRLGNIIGSGADAMIEIFPGDIEEKEKEVDDGHGKKKTIKYEIFKISDTPTKITIGTLENYIKSKKLEPRSEKEGEDKEKEAEIKDVKPKWGFAKWLFSNKSFAEIMKGLKMGLENFEHHLKEGNEEHASKVALATWGKFMPMEIRMELQARVETAEKKHMDEYVSRLEAMDSWQAVMLIDKRLTYKNTEEYKKEAGLVFMMKKYGNLYNKAPLNAKKGTFIWFKALSGYRGDVTQHPLYQEVMADCKKGNRNFTEEELVWILMKKQCGSHGYGGIHRMSRLHKEVEKYKKAGIKEEIEDGKKKADDTRSPGDQLKKGLDEIKAGSPANAIGRLEGLIDRGSDMATMNQIPFVLVYSGIAKTLPEDLSNHIKGQITMAGRLIPLARYMSYPKDINTAIETIKILSNKIEIKRPDLYGKRGNTKGIGELANELYDKVKNNSFKDENDKIDQIIKFYNTLGSNGKSYGEILTKVMYMSADGKDDDGSELSCILITDKDKSGGENSTLKEYFDLQTFYAGEGDSIKDDYMSDSFIGAGLSSLSYEVMGRALAQHSGGGYNMKKGGGKYLAEEIQKEIRSIKRRKYKNPEDQKAWLKYYLKNLMAGLAEAHPTRPDYANALFNGTGDLKFLSDEWGITFQEIVSAGLNRADILGGKGDNIFNQFVNNILNDEGGVSNISSSIHNILKPKSLNTNSKSTPPTKKQADDEDDEN